MSATDFREDYANVQRIDGAGDILRGTGANLARGRLAASALAVSAGRLVAVQSDGQTLIDAPVAEVQIGPRRRATPTAVSVDAGGHRWMVDFGYAHKVRQRNRGGFGAALASRSAIANLKSIRVGRQLRDGFVDALLAQGAGERSG